jgi:TorA maturation chaperone TorD
MLAVRESGPTSATLSRAALFRLLAEGFAYPATGHSADMQRGFSRLAPGVRGRVFAPPLASAVTAARRAWAAAADATLAGEYLRLFSGNGPVSLHEAAYGDGRRIAGRSVELADISGCYLAFGVSASGSDPDLPDHLSAELEFISLLLLKESHAAAQGWSMKSRIARDAAKAFLEGHLARWVGALATSLSQAGACAPYQALARLTCVAVAAECRNLGARPRSFDRRLPADPMQAESFACPLASRDEAARVHAGPSTGLKVASALQSTGPRSVIA